MPRGRGRAAGVTGARIMASRCNGGWAGAWTGAPLAFGFPVGETPNGAAGPRNLRFRALPGSIGLASLYSGLAHYYGQMEAKTLFAIT